MKKFFSLTLASAIFLAALTGCGSSSSVSSSQAPASSGTPASSSTPAASEATDSFDSSYPITVVSREDGSGTRGAFIELFGIEVKQDDGTKVDTTTQEAIIANKTDVMMTNVGGDEYAIGYASLGSLNDTIKAVKIDGAEATAENVKNGSYKVARPFNIATKGTPSAVAQDFIDFIMSAEGQAVVEEEGYISEGNSGSYSGSKPEGTIKVAGSSSVTPLMEKLKEAYLEINTSAKIEVQQSDSSNGMTSTIEGLCDIGMASRDLKDSETSQGLKATAIAIDGIAVIVNKENTVDSLTSEQIKSIYTGEITKWSEIE